MPAVAAACRGVQRLPWTSAAVACALTGGLVVMGRPCLAQLPGTSREELVQKWDLDRNGKVDANELEIARTKMRRARGEAAMKSGIDPLTGRARQTIDPVTGRPVPSGENRQPGASVLGPAAPSGVGDDGGLILVPGTGERPPGVAEGPAALPKMPPVPSTARDRGSLPGTRAPLPATASPQGTVRGPAAARPNEGDPRRQAVEPATRPGVIAGGVRAGGPGGRSTVGQAPPADLNAGRLPAGLPQARGGAVGTAAGARGTLPASPPATANSRLVRPGSQAAGVGVDPRQPATGWRGPGTPGSRTAAGEAGPGGRWPAGAVPGGSGQAAPRSGVPPGQTVPRPPVVPRTPRASVGDVYAR